MSLKMKPIYQNNEKPLYKNKIKFNLKKMKYSEKFMV